MKIIYLVLLFFVSKFYFSFAQIPNQGVCGEPAVSPDIKRIVNGFNAVPNSYPWMVSLRILFTPTQVSSHFCGGTLIYENVILTAAHCLVDRNVSSLAVIIGQNSVTAQPSSSNVFKVSETFVNEAYTNNGKRIANDIALLVLSKPVILSNNIKLACLPTVNDFKIPVNQGSILTGWGALYADGTMAAQNLQEAKLTVRNTFSDCAPNLPIDQSFVYCAIDQKDNPQANACFGDSGGPLLQFVNSKWYVYGVASFVLTANNKCLTDMPSFYTGVPAYLNWIESKLNANSMYAKNPSLLNYSYSSSSFKKKYYLTTSALTIFAVFCINFGN